ncbi:hypothetical protein KQI42_00020 [Tissierella sp. MSJ-40]|uniref:Uncharacterized protein n=1 Tax=Tissierella simiarum TaxID=2841534 RepID=A0ABS6E2A5_9FIRM|nr:hypothetical protein [Tissierella simiarum]MBU5436373.1 hypothetical protein [Tissierella simiarum]
MAEERNIRIEDSDGNIYYPHTKASNVKTSDGKNVETKLTEVFQSGLDGKNLLETSIKSKGGRVSKQGTVATFNELDLGIKSIETDKTGDATAIAGDILSGKTAYAKGKKLIGSMANRGAIDNTITTQGGQITIPAGYHNGSGKVKAQFSNLVAGNIKQGVNVGGVVGTLESSNFREEIWKPNFFIEKDSYNQEEKIFDIPDWAKYFIIEIDKKDFRGINLTFFLTLSDFPVGERRESIGYYLRWWNLTTTTYTLEARRRSDVEIHVKIRADAYQYNESFNTPIIVTLL